MTEPFSLIVTMFIMQKADQKILPYVELHQEAIQERFIENLNYGVLGPNLLLLPEQWLFLVTRQIPLEETVVSLKLIIAKKVQNQVGVLKIQMAHQLVYLEISRVAPRKQPKLVPQAGVARLFGEMRDVFIRRR